MITLLSTALGLLTWVSASAQPARFIRCNKVPTFLACLPPGSPTRSSVAPVAIGDGLRFVQIQQLLRLAVPSGLPAAFAPGDLRLFGWTDTAADQTAVFQRAFDALPALGGEIEIGRAHV